MKKFRPTLSEEKVVERENILGRDFSTSKINEKWVGDITYVYTLRNGWCYLASFMDLHSKKIIGHSFSHSMTTDLIVQALENAYHTQRPSEGLIFHSDFGTQYTIEAFANVMNQYNMTHSFSHKGSPYDNACIESFYAILKHDSLLCQASNVLNKLSSWLRNRARRGSMSSPTFLYKIIFIELLKT